MRFGRSSFADLLPDLPRHMVLALGKAYTLGAQPCPFVEQQTSALKNCACPAAPKMFVSQPGPSVGGWAEERPQEETGDG